MKFDPNFFIKQKFTEAQLKKHGQSAQRDLNIAQTSKESEVRFHFTYMAMLKAGIYYLARHGYRVKGVPGHHQKVIEALSRIMELQDIQIVGDKMRKDRNLDLYSAELLTSPEEIQEYFHFVKDLFKKIF